MQLAYPDKIQGPLSRYGKGMGIQFDRARVKEWFDRVCDTLGATDLTLLWVNLAYGCAETGIPIPFEAYAVQSKEIPTLIQEWISFSLWEKQAALYFFVPRIEQNAKHQAWLMSQKARSGEPL